MCECCERTGDVGSIAGLDYANDTWAYIAYRDGKPMLVMEQDCGSVSVTTRQEIGYCPKCGRDLRGGAE